MNREEAQSLQQGDQVTWRWEGANDDDTTPGTVIDTDTTGLEIFWSDCVHHPTRYDFEENASWPHIEKHTPELVYIPDPEHDAPIPKRRKRRT